MWEGAEADDGAEKGPGIGVNYGRVGNNLPSAKQAIKLLANTIVDKVKIYDSDPTVLQAFAHTGIGVVVCLENEKVQAVSESENAGQAWVSQRISPYYPATNIIQIMVGNEALTDTDGKISDALVPAMQNVHAALVSLNLADKIKVSTPHSMAVLESSFPPSAATFTPSLLPIMKPLLKFLEETGAPFMVNAYPYFAYRDNPKEVSLDYVLFGQSPGVKDPKGFTYNNMLDAQIDSVYSAMAALGHNDSIPVSISETGWPSKGDPADIGVNPENARNYNTRVIKHVTSNAGTPMRPNRVIDTYIFALFNENQKPGPITERNFGLLQPDGSKVYDIDLSCGYCGAAAPAPAPPPPAPLPMQWSRPAKGGRQAGAIWCIAKPSADPSVLQESLDFACGQGGADCSAIHQGGPCYTPNTVHAHASFAMNSYYHVHGRNYWNCDFKDTGLVTFTDPSYGSCNYPQQ
ncbi:hypothetical protein SUGI_0983680 [Cryptomeria japonica]|nr:hypothetical protein SUGI_0983680 [Cryptomeria japonica]